MRVMIYSHDTYGLGHIRRTLELARQLSDQGPHVSQLLITGSMQAHMYPLPARLDYLKLPAIDKHPSGDYCSRAMVLPFDTVLAMRENIILEAARNFEPDLVLVDKAPAGMKGEMLGTLRYLKSERPETKLVLGLRDIDDEAQQTRHEWTRDSVYALLEDTYDAILFYGSRAIYDPVREYGLASDIAEKIIQCGYIRKSDPVLPPADLRRALNMKTDRLVVVAAGGGGDGFELLRTHLQMLEDLTNRGEKPQFHSLVVTGPQMASVNKEMLRRYESLGLPLTLMEFTPHLLSYMNAADLVISMGGYNTVCEILSLNQRAIIVPRVRPRIEQLLRAERFSARGLFHMIHPDKLTPCTLADTIDETLRHGRPVLPEQVGIDMNGAAHASQAMLSLLGQRQAKRSTPYGYALAAVA